MEAAEEKVIKTLKLNDGKAKKVELVKNKAAAEKINTRKKKNTQRNKK